MKHFWSSIKAHFLGYTWVYLFSHIVISWTLWLIVCSIKFYTANGNYIGSDFTVISGLVSFIIIDIVVFLVNYINYKHRLKSKEYPILSFDMIKPLINLNPDKYDYTASNWFFETTGLYIEDTERKRFLLPNLWELRQFMQLIDNIYNEKETIKKEIQLEKDTKALLNAMQADISEALKQSEKEKQTAVENFEKIVHNTP